MTDTALERVLRRDRLLILAALIVITLLAWLYIARLAAAMDMGGMDMAGFRMVSTGLSMAMAPASRPWSALDFTLMFAMWTVMMIGMMTPSVAPLLLLHARVSRQAAEERRPIATTGWFAGGYLMVWTLFSLLATALQHLLGSMALLTPEMRLASQFFTAVVLIAAGLYQWLPVKDSCLSRCRSPFAFIQQHGGFARRAGGAFTLGLRHGAYCVGCCWLLMLLLFTGGVMALPWIAALTILTFLEKIAPGGHTIARLAGIGFTVAGLWRLA